MSEDKHTTTTPKQPEPNAKKAASTVDSTEGQGEPTRADKASADPGSAAPEKKASRPDAPVTAEKVDKKAEPEKKSGPVNPTPPSGSKDKKSNGSGGTPPPDGSQRSTGRGWGILLAVLILFIFLGALAGAGWWANEQLQAFRDDVEQSQSDWQAEWQSQWQEERETLISNINEMGQRVGEREEEVADILSDIEQTRRDLVTLAQQVNDQATLQDSDIQRLEIEYLMRTARHLTLLTGDLRQAESLLRQADRMLADFDDLAYLPVREALAQDIQRLREIPMPDVNGLYLELQALAERSLEWQWWPQTVDLSQPHEPERQEAVTWYEQAWHDVRELITVRYRNEPAQSRLSPREFNQLQGQFRLLMNQAQVALMQGNQTLYNTSLEQAMTWLETGANQVPQANLLVSQLAELRDQTVTVEIPEINRGLSRLQRMIERDAEEATGESE